MLLKAGANHSPVNEVTNHIGIDMIATYPLCTCMLIKVHLQLSYLLCKPF